MFKEQRVQIFRDIPPEAVKLHSHLRGGFFVGYLELNLVYYTQRSFEYHAVDQRCGLQIRKWPGNMLNAISNPEEEEVPQLTTG